MRVVPDIVATERHSHVQSRDICVSAPTGSGKTLVFVLGVLQVTEPFRETSHDGSELSMKTSYRTVPACCIAEPRVNSEGPSGVLLG